jgi:flagellar hook-length control protein FliK
MKTIFDAVTQPVFPSRRVGVPNPVVEQFADRLAAKVPGHFNQQIERPQDMRPVEKSLTKEPQRQELNSSKEVNTSDKMVKELEAQKKTSKEANVLEAFFVPIMWEMVEPIEEPLVLDEVVMIESVDLPEGYNQFFVETESFPSASESLQVSDLVKGFPEIKSNDVEAALELTEAVKILGHNHSIDPLLKNMEVTSEDVGGKLDVQVLIPESTKVQENPQDIMKDLNVESIEVHTGVVVKEDSQVKPQKLMEDPLLDTDLAYDSSNQLGLSSETTSTDTQTQDFTKESKHDKSIQVNKAPLDIDENTHTTFTQTQAQEVMDIESTYLNSQIVKTSTSPSAIMDQVKEALTRQLFKVGEHSEMIIKLKPEELGKLELKIEVHKESVIARFSVESQIVKEAIESNLADLKNSLKDKGFSDMTFDVNVSKEREGHQTPSHNGYKRVRRFKGNDISLERVEATYQKTLVSLMGNSQFEHLA